MPRRSSESAFMRGLSPFARGLSPSEAGKAARRFLRGLSPFLRGLSLFAASRGLSLFAVLALVSGAASPAFAEGADGAAQGAGDARLSRCAALVAELLDEGAPSEALAEAARLRSAPFWREGALDDLAPRLEDARKERPGPGGAGGRTPPAQGGSGSLFALAVVGFYRFAIGPAIGSRCALEPSCSRFFSISCRKHGWIGVPMTADRFVREPVVSAPDRPWVVDANGNWRHPDPVDDHDWWFSE